MDDTALFETLGLIYDVAVAPDRWPELLHRLTREFACHFGCMKFSSADLSEFRAVAVGVDPDEHQAFLRRFHRTNPITLRLRSGLSNELLDAGSVLPRAELERTEMYQAFYRPNDLGHVARISFLSDRAGTQSIALSRSWRAPRFSEKERTLARALIPHLQRAAKVARHLRNAELVSKTTRAVLNAAHYPTLLLNRSGRLVFANAGAEQLLRTADGLRMGRKGLVAASPAATRALEALVDAAARDPGQGGTLRLPRPSGKSALVLVAIPIRDPNDFFCVDHPAVIFCVSDPAARQSIDAGALTALFGLTRAEAEVARQLLAGHELPELAAASGRSLHTIRNQLARVMAKTETSRQSELVGLLGRLPRGAGDA